jgi:ribosomal protein S19E (S16A)
MRASGQVSRVAIDHEGWVAFRQAALARGISVSAYLGKLVETELKRRGGRAVTGVEPEAPAAEQAIAALGEVRASIDELDQIAGRLARSAAEHGASWSDVASSLRLDEAQARAAYGSAPDLNRAR